MGTAALIDVRIFQTGVFPTAATTQFLSNGMLFGRQLLVPLYLITGCGVSAPHTGWAIAAIGIGMMCSFPFVGFLTEHFGTRAVSAGGAFLAFLSMLPFLWMIGHEFSMTWTVASLFFAGAGQGTINIPSVSAAYSSVPKEKLPLASTALNLAQRLGGPVATTLLAVTMASSMRGYTDAQPQRFMVVFALLTALHLLAMGSALRLPVRTGGR
jgi:predicted MFS family arabinose efflux permease